MKHNKLLILFLLSTLSTSLFITACGSSDEKEPESKPSNTHDGNTQDPNKNDPNKTEPGKSDPTPPKTKPKALEDQYPTGAEVSPSGFFVFPPRPASCDKPSEKQVFPFVVKTNNEVPLIPGDLINGRKVVPNGRHGLDIGTLNLYSSAIQMATDIPRVLPKEENKCNAIAPTCDGKFFTCMPAGTRPDTEHAQLCSKPNSMFIDKSSLAYAVDGPSKQSAVSIVIDTSAAMNYAERYNQSINELPASNQHFRQTLRSLQTSLQNILRKAEGQKESAAIYNVITLAPSNYNVKSHTCPEGKTIDDSHCFTDNEAMISHVISAFDGTLNPRGLSLSGTGGLGTYPAITRAIKSFDDLKKSGKETDNFLIVFTASSSNSTPREDSSYAKILDSLKAKNIRTFFVHIDSPIVKNLDKLETDSPDYATNDQEVVDVLGTNWDVHVANGARSCQKEEDCFPNEACRKLDANNAPEGKFCRPKLNESHTFGPNYEYSNIACETGGSYFYYNDLYSTDYANKVLPYALDGLFTFNADLTALKDDTLTPGFYNLTGLFTFGINNSVFGSDFYSPMKKGVDSWQEDRRLLVRFEHASN